MNTPNVLYEDNHIIVAVKPQNIPTQGDSSGDTDFLSQIKEYVRIKYGKPGQAYIGLVHRLDRPAGGVMVFARTSKAAARLSKQIKDSTFQKTYLAIVSADIPPNGKLTHWLLKDTSKNKSAVVAEGTPGAKNALLFYEQIGQESGFSLLQISLITGRSHQIRVQLASIGAPLVGDVKYGGRQNDTLCLWSFGVTFTHPTTKQPLSFFCPPPDAFPWQLFEQPAQRLK